MNYLKYFGFILILVGSMATYTVFFRGTLFPTLFVLGSCSLFVVSYLIIDESRVHIPRYLLGPFIVLLGAYAITMPFRPTVFYRPVIDLIVMSVSMLLIPQAIDRSVFFVAVRNLSTILVLIGLPAIVAGPYSLFGTTVGYLWKVDLPVLSAQLYPLQSIYTNPNFLSVLLLSGMLASLYLHDANPTNYSPFVFLVNVIGLLLTQSRSAILVGVFAVLGYLLYKAWGTPLFRLAVLGGGFLSVGSLLLIVTGVGPLAQISLSSRREIWKAGIEVLLENPLIGYGQVPLKHIIEAELGFPRSPHNSYLRVFLETGIVGGIAYAWLIISILFHHVRLPLNEKRVISFLLALSVATVMVFETFVLGGVGSSSIIASMALGYVIKDVSDYGTIDSEITR